MMVLKLFCLRFCLFSHLACYCSGYLTIMHIKAFLFEVLFVFPFGMLLLSVLSVSATD